MSCQMSPYIQTEMAFGDVTLLQLLVVELRSEPIEFLQIGQQAPQNRKLIQIYPITDRIEISRVAQGYPAAIARYVISVVIDVHVPIPDELPPT